jgi:hypothetical protein
MLLKKMLENLSDVKKLKTDLQKFESGLESS